LIVLDASTVVELLLNTAAGARVASRIEDPQLSLHAPHLLDLEVAQAMRRYASVGILETDRAAQALTRLRELDLERWSHEPFLPRIWELRDNLTAYDGAYVALAEALDAPLVTFDGRIAAAPGVRAVVESP
jgi:predicted nucleic acid-binding protein